MAKYGAFKYGSGTKYGAGAAVVLPTPVGEVTWILTINWSGSSGYNEAINMTDLQVMRGDRYYLGQAGGGFQQVSTGTMTATLDNRGNRYDPYNTGSAIYPNVAPGAAVRLRVKVNATGTTYNVFSGVLSDIRPISGKNDQVKIEAVDYLKWVADRKVSIAAHYNIPVTTAIGYVLDDAAFPETRSIQTTTQPIYIFDPAEVDAYTIIQDLAAANLGQFFIDKSGKAVFYDLKYNGMTTHNIDQAAILKEFMVSQPWENKRDQITVEVNRRARLENATIWQGGPYVVQFYNYEDIEVSFSPASSLTIPPRYWGIKVTATYGGASVDITQACWVEIISYTSTTAKLRLHNGTGLVGTFQYVKLQGCQHVSSPTVYKYGTGFRTFTLSSPWLQDSGYGNAYDDLIYTHLSAGSKNPEIRIEQRPATQYAIELFDKVHFTSAARWIDGTWHVGGLQHKWNESSGQSVTTTLYLRNRLQSAATITPEPWAPVPEEPPTPIPNDPDPNAPEIPPPDDSTCLTDAATANGPFEIRPNDTYLSTLTGKTQTDIPYPCTLRPGTAANKSYLKIDGDYMYSTGAVVTNTALWTVSAIDANGIDIINGVNTQDSSVTAGYAGNRYATFSPAAAQTVTGFRILIPAASAPGNYTNAWTFNDGTFNGWLRCEGDESDGGTITLAVHNIAHWWNWDYTPHSGGIRIDNAGSPYRQALIYYPTDLYTKLDESTFISSWADDSGNGYGSSGAWIDEDGSGLIENAAFRFISSYSNDLGTPWGWTGTKYFGGTSAGKRILALYWTARDEGITGYHWLNEFRITDAELHNSNRSWNLSKLDLYNVCGEDA
jgi:hypothetical protein